MSSFEIVIEIEIDETKEKITKRSQHMIAKWPTLSQPKIYVSEVNEGE